MKLKFLPKRQTPKPTAADQDLPDLAVQVENTPGRFSIRSKRDTSAATDLGARVERARGRLQYQYDPALNDALSEDELSAERDLAEHIRATERADRRAVVDSASKAAARARETSEAIAKRRTTDLLRASRVLSDHQHRSSPYAKIAKLDKHRPWVLGLFVVVLVSAMVVSAVSVQHNIAPTGGPGNVWWWVAYIVEFLISGVLVGLMVSGGDTDEYGVDDNPEQARWTERLLLAVTVILNVYPYCSPRDWYAIGVHSIAPFIIGQALRSYRIASARYSRAIDRITAEITDEDDLDSRLAELTHVGPAGLQPAAGPGALGDGQAVQRGSFADSRELTEQMSSSWGTQLHGLDSAQPSIVHGAARSTTVQPETARQETEQPALSYLAARSETVHRAVEPSATVQQAGFRGVSEAPRTAQSVTPPDIHTERFARTEHDRTEHRAPVHSGVHGDSDVVHGENTVVRTEQHSAHSPSSDKIEDVLADAALEEVVARTAALTGGSVEAVQAVVKRLEAFSWPPHTVKAAKAISLVQVLPYEWTLDVVHEVYRQTGRTVQSTGADTDESARRTDMSEIEQEAPSTEQKETVQSPRTVQATVHPETVHRAARSTSMRPTVHTVHHTEEAKTVHRATSAANGQHSTEQDDREMKILAAEVHGRLTRTKFSVEEIAKVLIAVRRDGIGPDRIYRDKIGPHRDITMKWLKVVEEIEKERVAEMAPVIALRDRG